jgi:hypothetical protein
VRWFGPTWDAPANEETEEVEAPSGVPCLYCRQGIVKGERGVVMPTSWEPDRLAPVHLHCLTKWVLGR